MTRRVRTQQRRMAALHLHQLPLALPMTRDELRATLVVLSPAPVEREPEPVVARLRRAAS